jgi:hypothetical protein
VSTKLDSAFLLISFVSIAEELAYDQWTDLLFGYGLNDRIEVVGVMKNYSEIDLGQLV